VLLILAGSASTRRSGRRTSAPTRRTSSACSVQRPPRRGSSTALDVKAEEIIAWTDEARERMQRVPAGVAGVARTALLRYAIEQGHTVITSKVIDEAMGSSCRAGWPRRCRSSPRPRGGEAAADEATVSAICSVCGYAVKGPNPVVKCPVCGGGPRRSRWSTARRWRPSPRRRAASRGGGHARVSVRWRTTPARDCGSRGRLSPRRRRRGSRSTRAPKIPVITKELAFPLIEETVGREKLGAGWRP